MDIVNQKQFAEMLGISTEAVRQLRMRERPGPPFPAPEALGPRVLIWSRADAEAYVEARKKYLQSRKSTLDTSQA